MAVREMTSGWDAVEKKLRLYEKALLLIKEGKLLDSADCARIAYAALEGREKDVTR